jgi:hypothetical protein
MMPKDVRTVLWSGAGGGIVSWAFTILSGSTFGLSIWAALPLTVMPIQQPNTSPIGSEPRTESRTDSHRQ